MNLRICGLLTTAALVSCFLASAQTLARNAYTIADLGADWSDTSNPNGAWQYREGTIDLAHFPNWLPGGTAGQPAWAGGNNTRGNFCPHGSRRCRR
jgi:hypothetical protein